MEVTFRTKKMMKAANTYRKLQKEYGDRAKRIALRLQQLIAAENLEAYGELDPAARLHQLSQNRDEEFAVDVRGNERLVFEVANDPVPRKDDDEKAIDRGRVTKIRVLELCEDYHG